MDPIFTLIHIPKPVVPSRNEEIRSCARGNHQEHWYGDEAPSLGKSFTAKKTAERQQEVVQILGRAAKRAAKAGSNKLAQAYDALADKLDACRPRRRCGSLACPKCARAFQTAKVAAQRRLIKKLAKARSGKQLVMASVIPLSQEAEAPRRGNPSRREFRDIASGDRGRPPLADTTRCAGCRLCSVLHSARFPASLAIVWSAWTRA